MLLSLFALPVWGRAHKKAFKPGKGFGADEHGEDEATTAERGYLEKQYQLERKGLKHDSL